MQRILLQLVALVEYHPFQLGQLEICPLTELLLHFFRHAHYYMTVLEHSTINTTHLQCPLKRHLVKITIGQQIVINLGKQSLSGNHNQCLRSPNLVIFVFFELLANTRDIFQGIEDGYEICECFSSAIIGIDDST